MWKITLFLVTTLFSVQAQSQFSRFKTDNGRTLKSVEAELQNLALVYPSITKLEVYGKTLKGHPLYVLKISDNPQIDENEVELMMTSATHGDEKITVEVEMELINTLLRQYKTNPRLAKMINENELFFIPIVSPDSYEVGRREVQGVDPNRDYPSPRNVNKKSIDCISALIKWFDSRSISGSLDLHAGTTMIMYPWAYTSDATPASDLKKFEDLADVMSEENKFPTGQISDILYPAVGSSADYYYWKKKTLAFGVEINDAKNPPISQIPEVVNDSTEMVWKFIEYFSKKSQHLRTI